MIPPADLAIHSAQDPNRVLSTGRTAPSRSSSGGGDAGLGRWTRNGLIYGTLVGLLCVTGLLSLSIGAVRVSPGQVLAILAEPAGVTLPWAVEPQQSAVILGIRLPRIVLGVLIGAALAICGAVTQGMFRNPLADPVLIGVSNGAALGAAAVFVLGRTLLKAWVAYLGAYALSVAAFVGGLLAVLAVQRIADRDGHVGVTKLILAGIAVNALAMAMIGFLVFLADDDQLRSFTFWTLGSLGRATWTSVAAVAPLLVVTVALMVRYAHALNLLLLGEREAGHLGISVARTKRVLILLLALAVGASVSASGVVGFVGILVPHALRLVAGPDYRVLLPASALLGGTLLIAADLAARTLVAPAELPLGILTAALGAPFFLWLLGRRTGL